MSCRIPSVLLSTAAGLMFLCHAGASGAQSVLASGPDAEVTQEGLHRVNPLIMEAAWVKPDLDLSSYTRIFLVPTAVQFREVDRRNNDGFTRTRSGVRDFPVNDEKQEWLRGTWSEAVEAEFSQEQTYELYSGAGSDVLVVQGILADVVSRIPPDAALSNYTWIRDPWTASVVLELRDGATGEFLARTIDRRTGEGLLDSGAVWMLTEDLLVRWAEVLSERLGQLSDLEERGQRLGGR